MGGLELELPGAASTLTDMMCMRSRRSKVYTISEVDEYDHSRFSRVFASGGAPRSVTTMVTFDISSLY